MKYLKTPNSSQLYFAYFMNLFLNPFTLLHPYILRTSGSYIFLFSIFYADLKYKSGIACIQL